MKIKLEWNFGYGKKLEMKEKDYMVLYGLVLVKKNCCRIFRIFYYFLVKILKFDVCSVILKYFDFVFLNCDLLW